jgi:uncharacterized membrane protein
MKAKKTNAKKSKAGVIAVACLVAAALILGIILLSTAGANTENKAAIGTAASASGADPQDWNGIVIDKSKITEQAEFYSYKAGNTEMEVLAVKTPDGTIRTAMNTCQICYDSGAGYYVQEGDELVCQNCGNRFNISKIEKQKNGCNPVPITGDYKTEDDNTIKISGEFLDANKELFADWKR